MSDASDPLPSPTGRVLQVNVSRGGVPKLPVPSALVTERGVEGDRQRETTVHGGPTRAVSLLAMETIERVQADGHPIEPGSTGENLTTWGIEIGRLAPGTRLLIGGTADGVLLELNAPANPCKTIQASFVDGRFGRLSAVAHPGDTRVYAWVRRPGRIGVDDPIRVLPPTPDSEGAIFEVLDDFEAADQLSIRMLWAAASDAGYAIRMVDDGELLFGSCDALPGPAFNQVRGLDILPDALARARHFAARAQHPVWVQARRPPWPGAIPQSEQTLRAAEPDGIARVKLRGDIALREARPEDAALRAEILIRASGMEEPLASGFRALTPRMAGRHGLHAFIAELDGTPVGTATLIARRHTGLLRGAAVLPEARGRGLHQALIALRAARASDLGCDLVVASATSGSASDRNLERSGLRAVGRMGAYRLDRDAHGDGSAAHG